MRLLHFPNLGFITLIHLFIPVSPRNCSYSEWKISSMQIYLKIHLSWANTLPKDVLYSDLLVTFLCADILSLLLVANCSILFLCWRWIVQEWLDMQFFRFQYICLKCTQVKKVKVPLDNFCPVVFDSRGRFPNHRASVLSEDNLPCSHGQCDLDTERCYHIWWRLIK